MGRRDQESTYCVNHRQRCDRVPLRSARPPPDFCGLDGFQHRVTPQEDTGPLQPNDLLRHNHYEAHKGEMDQLHARHILIRFQGSAVPLRLNQKDLTDAEALEKAKDLRAKILAGAKFTEVAQAESDDVGSGQNGGDLDPFGHGAMIPEFEKAAFALKVGELSQPVRSAFGYHLILVETHTTKTFDDALPDILKAVGPASADKAVEELKNKAKVTYN